jgi:hypothetical protein
MQSMGGRIMVSSEEGRGATFTVQIPQWPVDTRGDTSHEDTAGGNQGNGAGPTRQGGAPRTPS